ncbi:hypothetical protein NDN08_000099 [Rhodosorus marinus]|uniref:Anaphase-promoting complex subunit 2 n=1 Tax=Rhodosorus marinus TaxID=101924 RepID=A0AAV8UE71_9RHOD|nr:hypothetical protein NDN08_000099 [Rhodosorus marinus]
MERVWRLCESSTTIWSLPDKQRDWTLSEEINRAGVVERLVLTKALADIALISHEEKLKTLIEEQLPAAIFQVHLSSQSGRNMEKQLTPVLRQLGDQIMSSRGNLEALSTLLGNEAAYVNVFLANHIQAVTEKSLPECTEPILSKILRDRIAADLDGFQEFCAAWKTLGLKASILDIAWESLSKALDREIEERCHNDFEEAALGGLREWLEDHAIPVLQCILSQMEADVNDDLSYWRARLEFQMCYSLSQARIRQLFDIILDFPHSEPVLGDINIGLVQTDLALEVASSLRKQLELRLLHQGAHTADIILQYVHLVKALRHIDPRRVIVEQVCEPIRAYLRTRPDTIRCIVTDVTEYEGELLEVLEDAVQDDDDSVARDETFDAWQPDPADASVRAEDEEDMIEQNDPLARLFDVYGSREAYANEYRKMLGHKLLTSQERGADVEREIWNVEMFKARFGSEAMQDCSVMLKDYADTKRIMAATAKEHSDLNQDLEFIIMSKHFWPETKEQDGELPDPFREDAMLLQKHFEETKAPRKLKWQPDLGIVLVRIEMESGKELSMTVSPNQAALFKCFEKVGKWKVDDLAEELKLSKEDVEKNARRWLQRGLLKEVDEDSLQLVEDFSSDAALAEGLEGATAADDKEDLAVNNTRDEMKVYETFLLGMLTNLGSLPVERIHNMLKMFCQNPPFDKTKEQLVSLLDELVVEEKIQVNGREYSLRTNN